MVMCLKTTPRTVGAVPRRLTKTLTGAQAQVYKTGVLNVDALNWPEEVTTLSAKIAAFVGSGISVQPLAYV